jgi:alpha-mannosidase II
VSDDVVVVFQDPRRKFIWEEMSYLERWWRDASEQSKKDFVRLVKTGQLEVVGGGWVMNDEANSHYFAIIEQVGGLTLI